jgi:outer membrane immunogenic protein
MPLIISIGELEMKMLLTLRLGAVALFAAGMAGTVSAADLPVKAPPMPPVVAYNWTGFYVGGFVGAAGMNNVNSPDATNPSAVTAGAFTFLAGTPVVCDGGTPGLKTGCVANYSMSTSVTAGGTAGYNWQFGKTVAGLEGEFGYMRLTGSGVLPFIGGAPCGAGGFPCVATFSTRVGDWYGTLAGRIGVTADALHAGWSNRVLLYAKGGAAVTRLSAGENIALSPPVTVVAASFTGAKTIWGWVAGAGAEWAVDQHWSLKAEYEYLGFNQSAGGCSVLAIGAAGAGGTWCEATRIDGIHTGKLGVNYRFGGPVVAKY